MKSFLLGLVSVSISLFAFTARADSFQDAIKEKYAKGTAPTAIELSLGMVFTCDARATEDLTSGPRASSFEIVFKQIENDLFKGSDRFGNNAQFFTLTASALEYTAYNIKGSFRASSQGNLIYQSGTPDGKITYWRGICYNPTPLVKIP